MAIIAMTIARYCIIQSLVVMQPCSRMTMQRQQIGLTPLPLTRCVEILVPTLKGELAVIDG